MLWAIFSILTALAWSISNIIDKFLFIKWTVKPIVPVMISGIIGLIISLAVYLTHGFAQLSGMNLFLSIVAGIFYILAILFYFRAVKIEEISRVAPLLYLNILFILILAFIFLGEKFTAAKYTGVVLLLAGAILISKKDNVRIGSSRALFLMMLSGLSIAINAIITKYLLNFADFWTIFAYTRGIGTVVALIPLYYLNFQDLVLSVKQNGLKILGVITISQLLTLTGGILITVATSLGPVTLVNALLSVQPFFVLVLAVALSYAYPGILKEETGKSAMAAKIIAIILMFIGAILVS